MDGCWELFWATGLPIAYLLYRMELEREEEPARAKTAWKDTAAALV